MAAFFPDRPRITLGNNGTGCPEEDPYFYFIHFLFEFLLISFLLIQNNGAHGVLSVFLFHSPPLWRPVCAASQCGQRLGL